MIVHTKKKTRLFKAFDECFDSMSADYDCCYMFSWYALLFAKVLLLIYIFTQVALKSPSL